MSSSIKQQLKCQESANSLQTNSTRPPLKLTKYTQDCKDICLLLVKFMHVDYSQGQAVLNILISIIMILISIHYSGQILPSFTNLV